MWRQWRENSFSNKKKNKLQQNPVQQSSAAESVWEDKDDSLKKKKHTFRHVQYVFLSETKLGVNCSSRFFFCVVWTRINSEPEVKSLERKATCIWSQWQQQFCQWLFFKREKGLITWKFQVKIEVLFPDSNWCTFLPEYDDLCLWSSAQILWPYAELLP